MRAKTELKPPQTYAQKVAGKQAIIFDAAKEVFAQNGYDGLRMSEVAKRAGVAEGTIYSYFSSKDDLIRALVGDYWTQLTEDARRAINGIEKTFARLSALAQFHIDALIARYYYAELTITLGRQPSSVISLTDDVRAYVRVFDEIFMAGQDRGDIEGSAELWMARDMLYGSLEYSARTLLMRGANQSETKAVVANLMQSFRARYGPDAKTEVVASPQNILDRLAAVTEKLEAKLID